MSTADLSRATARSSRRSASGIWPCKRKYRTGHERSHSPSLARRCLP
jgi:hypothetical protein